MACAVRGRTEPAAQAAGRRRPGGRARDRRARARLQRHLPAGDGAPGRRSRPRPLVLGAHEGATVNDVLAAYAAGFEAMGALTAAGHPALYDRGWHPTAVCGAVGAAVAAAHLLDADRDTAAGLATLRAGGLRAAFGSDNKSIQVDSRPRPASRSQLAGAGAGVARRQDPRGVSEAWREWDTAGSAGSREIFAVARLRRPQLDQAVAVLPADPGAIECAERVGAPPDGPLTVLAHPVSRQAAGDEVATPLQAKFSIPYTPRSISSAAAARRRLRGSRPSGQASPRASASAPIPTSASRSSRCSPATRSSPRRRRPRLAAAPALGGRAARQGHLAGDRFDELPVTAGGAHPPPSARPLEDALAQRRRDPAMAAAFVLEAQQRRPHRSSRQRAQLVARRARAAFAPLHVPERNSPRMSSQLTPCS